MVWTIKGISKIRCVTLEYLWIICLRSQNKKTSKALTHKMTLTFMMHFLSFFSSWVYVTSCFTDHYFFLFWWKRSIQNWAIFFVLKSATIIFKFITLTVKKWKFALYIEKEMPLLCNEDDSLVANVLDVSQSVIGCSLVTISGN